MPPELTLGNVSIQSFECPDTIDHFGGYQKLVVHDFPGGIRTVQTMGRFAPAHIKWAGQFFQADVVPDLQQRADLLNQMVTSGQPQILSFGAYQYNVIVHYFAVQPRNQWWQPYTIDLVPFQDTTSSAQTQMPVPSSVSQLAQNNASLLNQIKQSATLPTAPPAGAASALTSFQNSMQQALQNSLGKLPNVQTPAVQTGLQQAQSAMFPLAASTTPGVAPFALKASATLGVMNNTLNPVSAGVLAQITQVNPNLFTLAEQYYLDARKWDQIAKVNSLSVPNPIGIYQLTIPALAS